MKNSFNLNAQSISAIGPENFTQETDLKKHWLVFQRRWWLILLATVMGVTVAALYIWLKPKSYQASGKLLFKVDQSAQLTGFDSRSGEMKSVTYKTDPLTTEGEIIKSQPVLDISAKALNLKDRKGESIDGIKLAKKLVVKQIAGTDILQVKYQAEDGNTATRVVDQVMRDYIANNLLVNRSQMTAARQFIAKELPQAEAAVRQAENALRRFREANGVVALESETQESVKNMGQLTQNIDSSTSQLAQAEARVAQLRAQVGMDVSQAMQVNALNQSEAVQKALAALRQSEADLAKQRTIYAEGTPEIMLLVEQVQAARSLLQNQTQDITGAPASLSQLQARAETERKGLREGLASLVKSRSALGVKSQALPGLEATQRELQRQVDAAQTTYKTLLTKLQEVQVTENQNVGNARIVSAAIVPEAAAADLLNGVMVAGGGLAGLLLGLALAFLVDFADRSVKTLQEVVDLMPYSVLGVIPQMTLPKQEASLEGMPQLITGASPQFGGQEAYQMLQANLRFLPVDQVARSIMVTSAGRGEGKSTVAANLALALAQGHRRVLVVDADMRHSCQHHVWQMSNAVGLSNVLVGQVRLEQAVVAVRSNLHVLTAGTLPPNPLVLLDSSVMALLVERLTREYDFVVFDAPMVMGTADSTVLNQMVDGSLIVTRMGVAEIERLKLLRQFLGQSGHRVLGMVVNGVDLRADQGGYFYDVRQGSKVEKVRGS
jgi:polysaccharide biosynthesis transport protein